MRNIYIYILLIFFSLVFMVENNRMVTIGGCVTETVFALGEGKNVVAVDQSSIIPDIVTDLPQAGYIRGISIENILSMNPTQILTTTDIGPPKIINQLNQSGINVKIFNSPKTYDDILTLISDVALFLDVEDKGIVLRNDLIKLNDKINSLKFKTKPKIAFFMSPSSGSYTAAGGQTRADYLINYLGGTNVFSKEFNRYSKVSKEQILACNPDIILVGYVRESNKEEIINLFKEENIFQYVSAINNDKIYSVNVGQLLSFGPSFVNSASELIEKINLNE